MLRNLALAASKATEQAKVAAEAAKLSATEISSQALQSASNYIPTSENCTACGKTVSAARNITGIGSLLICVCCGGKFCKDCLLKPKELIPEHLWSERIPKSKSGRGYICKLRCHLTCVAYWMEKMVNHYEILTIDIMGRYLSERLSNLSTYQKPELILDTKARKAKRLFYLAEYAADAIGLENYFKAIKFAALGTGALSEILQGDTAKILYPLMECLKQFGIEGPTGLLRVYYLGCKYQLERVMDPCLATAGHSQADDSVPTELLDFAGKYSGPAQWLYSAVLPEPHDDEDWTKWYLSRIVSRQGWKLLFASVQSSILPNGVSCPAFALVCRDDPLLREALLIVRGTQTSVDWTINLEETLFQFTYRSGPKGETPVEGFVHTGNTDYSLELNWEGMMLGALAILDVFGMRNSIYSLVDANYDLKIVGHSLGAGTAALLTAEIKNGLYSRGLTQGSSARPINSDLPRVTAIGYGCPPVVSHNLADALIADEIMLTVIHGDDIIPRMSRFNLEQLAREVIAIIPTADQWKLEDQACLQRYAASYGVVGNMAASEEIRTAEKPTSDRPPQEEVSYPEEDGDECDPQNYGSTPVSVAKDLSNHILKDASVVFVVPGKIIHLTVENGINRAVFCDYHRCCLRSITPLSHGIDDHKMSNHIKALRILKYARVPSEISTPPCWQPFYNSENKQWELCSVCDSDLTWLYITKSGATRALVSHHCRACGKVVCSLCASKGDIIPTEGIGKYCTLPDWSISLPSFGYVEPERVCLPCYLHSYHL